MAVTPLDVVKCNIQIDPLKYKNISTGFGMVVKEQGMLGLFKGWAPTLVGYSAQGAFKFGLYEYFKKCVHAGGILHDPECVGRRLTDLISAPPS